MNVIVSKTKLVSSRIIMILVTWVVTLILTQIGYAETLFFDDFNSGKISNAYKFTANGKWEVKNGSLHQTNPASTDSCHAVIFDQKYPDEITIQTKLRVNDWSSGDYARTGIGVRVDPDKGEGYDFLFSDYRASKPNSVVAFLNDHVAWGPAVKYEWEINTWYWMQLHIDKSGHLQAKVWLDGKVEPKDWTAEIDENGFSGARATGYPSLCGESGGGGGTCIVEFDSVEVWDSGGSTHKLAVDAYGKLVSTWAEIKVQ
jgi:hypothetical protein